MPVFQTSFFKKQTGRCSEAMSYLGSKSSNGSISTLVIDTSFKESVQQQHYFSDVDNDSDECKKSVSVSSVDDNEDCSRVFTRCYYRSGLDKKVTIKLVKLSTQDHTGVVSKHTKYKVTLIKPIHQAVGSV